MSRVRGALKSCIASNLKVNAEMQPSSSSWSSIAAPSADGLEPHPKDRPACSPSHPALSRRSLVQAGAIGLVTTHDLSLTHIVEVLAPRAANVHFADHIENGRMVWDYKMRPGVVQNSNAIALMRAVGLEV